MTIADALSRVKTIAVKAGMPTVMRTVAEELAGATGGEITIDGGFDSTRPAPGVFHLLPSPPAEVATADPDSVYVRLDGDGSGCVAATPIRLLFSFITHLLRDLAEEEIGVVAGGGSSRRLSPGSAPPMTTSSIRRGAYSEGSTGTATFAAWQNRASPTWR